VQAHKLQVKIYAAPSSAAAPEAFIPIFHAWIKHRVLPELMIDVANYAHVPKGPGVVLIGNDSDYFIDEGDGRFGLLYNRKRSPPPPAERLSDAFRRALRAARLLEAEPALSGTLRFSPNELLFRINDRLLAPNTDETFAAVRPELEALADRLFGGPFQLQRTGDPKELFTVTLRSTSPSAMDVSSLLARLGESESEPLPLAGEAGAEGAG
jgi:hypothetical protein